MNVTFSVPQFPAFHAERGEFTETRKNAARFEAYLHRFSTYATAAIAAQCEATRLCSERLGFASQKGEMELVLRDLKEMAAGVPERASLVISEEMREVVAGVKGIEMKVDAAVVELRQLEEERMKEAEVPVVAGFAETVVSDAAEGDARRERNRKAREKKKRRKAGKRAAAGSEAASSSSSQSSVPEWRQKAVAVGVGLARGNVVCVNCGRCGCTCSELQVSYAMRRVAENKAAMLKAARAESRLKDKELQAEYDEMAKLQVLNKAKASALEHERNALKLESVSPSSSASMVEVKRMMGEIKTLHGMLLEVAKDSPEVHAKALKQQLKQDEMARRVNEEFDCSSGESKEDEAYERGGHLPIMAELRAMAKERMELASEHLADEGDMEYERLLKQAQSMHM